MLSVYIIVLIILLFILLLLINEENRFRKKTTHGLTNKYWILQEKRTFVRFNKKMNLRYSFAKNSHVPSKSTTTNISRKGLCLLTYEKFDKKDLLNLEIEPETSSDIVKLTGEVVWIKELKNQDAKGRRQFYTGVRFYNITPESEARLLTYLNKLKAV